MSIGKIVEDAFREAALKMHIENKDAWHEFLRKDGAQSCFVCGLQLREAALDV